MEFVVVKFPKACDVLVDGQQMGQTNGLIRLQAGTHRFELDLAGDYAPKTRKLRIIGTSQDRPKEIVFDIVALLGDELDDVAGDLIAVEAVSVSSMRKTARRLGGRRATAAAPVKSPAKKAPKGTKKKTAGKAVAVAKKTARKSVKKTAKKVAKRPVKKVAKKSSTKSAKKAAARRSR
ncbi:MAG: hypothetical protein ACO1Q7_17455 [Gemmatimonas sp.]